MKHIKTQKFYERFTGAEHEVTILFGGINPISSGHYQVRVDGEFYSNHYSMRQVDDEVLDIIKYNNWTPLKPI